MKQLSIKTKIIFMIVATIVTTFGAFTLNTVLSMQKITQQKIEIERISLVEEKKNDLVLYSDMAFNVIRIYYDKTKMVKDPAKIAKIKQEALVAVRYLRYGKNGYFWINDMNYKMLMHPIKPKYDNHIFIKTPKVPFVELGVDKLKKKKKLEAFIDYSFYTPATKKYSHKLSLVRVFQPWGWVIGTGVYTDYIEARIQKDILKSKQDTYHTIKNMLVISMLLLIFFIVFTYIMFNKIILKPLFQFKIGLDNFFKKINNEDFNIERLDDSMNDEIGSMAKEINRGISITSQTYNELIQLRKKLQQEVKDKTNDLEKTKGDYLEIQQSSKHSLEYGALIQSSIQADKDDMSKVFTDSFMINNYQSLINSKFTFFEEINPHESIFILIDTKKEQMDSVLSSMLINALVKKALSIIKDKDDLDISFILEYINTNIITLLNKEDEFISKNSFDGAIIYCDKQNKIIKYSAANIPFYYHRNGVFSIVNSTNASIGIDIEKIYTQQIIEMGDSIEFYICSDHFMHKNLDLVDFNSLFNASKEKLLTNVDNKDIVVVGFKIDTKPKQLLEYDGLFTQDKVNKYVEVLEDKVENIGILGNLSTNFIEQSQNIMNYAKSKDGDVKELSSCGYIEVEQDVDGAYSIKTKNILSLSDKEKIEPKLFEISSMDKDAIKKRYRELRRSSKDKHQKGGGIGFYEIAKRTSKIKYSFKQLNKERFEFEFISFLSSSK